MKITYLPRNNVNTVLVEFEVDVSFGGYMKPLLERKKKEIIDVFIEEVVWGLSKPIERTLTLELDGRQVEVDVCCVGPEEPTSDLWIIIDVAPGIGNADTTNVMWLGSYDNKIPNRAA